MLDVRKRQINISIARYIGNVMQDGLGGQVPCGMLARLNAYLVMRVPVLATPTRPRDLLSLRLLDSINIA